MIMTANQAFSRIAFTLALVAILSVALVFSGCAALHARGDVAATIPAKATVAQTLVDSSTAGTLSEATARAFLSGDALTIQTYDETMTVNWFAYAFGDKKIFVTAELYNKIHAVAQDAASDAKRATSCPADDAKAQAVSFAKALIYIEKTRQGVK